MFVQVLALILVLAAGPAQAATWYVTQAGAGAADGTSYANAFAGWSDINMAGLSAGDTVIICGTVSSASKMSITKAGTSGSPITFTGLCPPEGSTATGVLDGLNTATPVLQLSEAGLDASYVTLEDLEIKNSRQQAGDNCLIASSLGGGVGYNIFSRLTVHHCGGGNGVIFQKPNPTLEDSTVYDVGGDAVGFSSAGTNAIIRRNTVSEFSTLYTYGDAIACAEDVASGALIQDNVVIFNVLTSVKQGIVCGNNGTGAVIIEGNTVTAPVSTEDNHGISFVSGKGIIRNNTITGFSGCVAIFTGAITTLDITGNACFDSMYTVFISTVAGSPTFNIVNNTGYNVKHGLSTHATISTPTLTHYNNLYRLASSSTGYAMFVSANTVSYTGNNNLVYPPHTGMIFNGICGGGTYDTLAAYQAACAQDAATLGTDPLTTTTGRLFPASPARRAGRYSPLCIDARGRVCPSESQNIGAYQSTSGDPAATRAVRN